MLWEAVFLLLILKIPLIYMCLVVWWAIRAEPRDEEPASVAAVTDTPSPPTAPVGSRPRVPHGPNRRDRRRPERERIPARPAVARGEMRR
jgi:hypothetical protein